MPRLATTLAANGSAAGRAGSDVLSRLQSLIASGGLAAGQALIELDLAQRLNASRPMVREALRQLESDGLADRSRARGLAVRRLTRKDVEDLYELREVLEAQAARRATQRFASGAATIGPVLQQARQLWVQAAASGELMAFSEANRRLHELVIEASGNAHLPRMLDRTLMELFASQMRGWILQPKIVQSAREHIQLIDALLSGDDRAAQRVMRMHVRSSAQAILSLPDEAF